MGAIAVLFSIVTFVCSIIILIDAFKNEWWKGLLCLFCPFYIFYYAFVEFENEKKGLILAVWLACMVVGIGLQAMAISSAVSQMPR